MLQIIIMVSLFGTVAGSISNLVTDQGFQIFNHNLNLLYTNGVQDYSYRFMLNGQSSWYSLVSGSIVVRQKRDLQTTVIDTVSNNNLQIICQDFHITDSQAYELYLDIVNDNNTSIAQLTILFNNQKLMQRYFFSNKPNRQSFTVYLSQAVNTLCFQGRRSGSESDQIGVLIDNVTLIPYQYRDVSFISNIQMDRLNYIRLISNQTVIDDIHLSLFRSETILQIPQTCFQLKQVSKDILNNLQLTIQITCQYASLTSKPIIILPQFRNTYGQLVIYKTSAQNLPRWIYSTVGDQNIVSQCSFYLILLTKIYNISYRSIKIIGFAYLGNKFWSFFYISYYLSFLNIQFILPVAQTLRNEMALITINTQFFKFFMTILNFEPFKFWSQYIPIEQKFDQEPSFNLKSSQANISPNLYSLIIDNLTIALFNTFKIVILYSVVFRSNKKFRKILMPIKNQKILVEYISIISCVIFASFRFWGRTGLVNSYGKINLAFGCTLTIISVSMGIYIFLNQWQQLRRVYKDITLKNGIRMQCNQNLNKYYQNQIKITLIQNLMFSLIPGLVGTQNIYATLSIMFLMVLLKLRFQAACLKYKRQFIQFLWFISNILQTALVIFYLAAQIFTSFPQLSPTAQVNWMIILKYNSISIVFMYISIGFIKLSCCIYELIVQFQKAEYMCPNNRIQNIYQSQIRIQQKTDLQQITNNSMMQCQGIKVINNLKDRVQRNSQLDKQSLQQLSNPFKIQSKKTLTFRQVTGQPQKERKQNLNLNVIVKNKQNQSPSCTSIQDKIQCQNRPEVKIRINKVVTMKHIEPIEQVIKYAQHKRSKSKSVYEQKNTERDKAKQRRKKSSLKLIQKLDILKAMQQKQDIGVNKNLGKSTFQIQENFS